MQDPVLISLQNDLARLKRIEALPTMEQAPYQEGIAKLKTRIEQLRQAAGLTADDYIRRYAALIDQIPPAKRGLVDPTIFVRLVEAIDDYWLSGNKPGFEAALKNLGDYFASLPIERQEAFL